ncbi:antirestriction protein ArdA [Paenibacillus sp. YN15]|uniref:antirestriction protein ArdA n=1 Tax=Paenibacillus sp. YN15 TaxID=1742774 RepID=UPI000DCE8798|nr:antirestriction protein ArdA [Paenibacillus sp. YN15]RAV02693.1 hypothetical protein DQG13_09325 [Paenibacillus sp. YN15]
MQIRVCAARRIEEGKGTDGDGEWLSLPMPVNQLDRTMRRIGGSRSDWIITDWEAPFWIEEDEDICWINEVVYTLAGYDKRLVHALCGCIDSLDMFSHGAEDGPLLCTVRCSEFA